MAIWQMAKRSLKEKRKRRQAYQSKSFAGSGPGFRIRKTVFNREVAKAAENKMDCSGQASAERVQGGGRIGFLTGLTGLVDSDRGG